MAQIDFPTSPAVGQQFVFGSATWTWDGTKWVAYPGALSVPDAPLDNTFYGRKSVAGVGAWANPTHNDISDWAAQLSLYYPTSNPAGYQTAAQVTIAIAAAIANANIDCGAF